MDEALNEVTHWLLSASSQVGSEYMQLPVAGKKDPDYRERVYCYELYHRWRCQWLASFPYSLCGEVDKRKHTYVRGPHLDNSKPDFLVHDPGYMRNLLVMEVKAAEGNEDDMAADLKKLTAFRRELLDGDGRPANYHAAYFWIYGISGQEWPCLRDKIVRKVVQAEEADLSLISCFVHERAGIPAVRLGWQD